MRKIHAPIVPQRKRSFVQNSQQQLPQRVAGLLDLVEKQNRKLQLLREPLVQRFLRQQRMRLAMTQISRRRTDQLRNLMRVLKLGAIDLDAGMRVAEQRLRHGFHHARLPRARWPKKKQVAHRTPRGVQPRQKHLVNLGDLLDGLVLTYDAAAQCGFKFSSIGAAAVRIEHCSKVRSHKVASFLSQAIPRPSFCFTRTLRPCSPLHGFKLTKFVIWNHVASLTPICVRGSLGISKRLATAQRMDWPAENPISGWI